MEGSLPLRHERLHAEFAKSSEDQESVFDKQLVGRDRPTHGVKAAFSLFSARLGHLRRMRGFWRVERFAVGYVNRYGRFGQLRLGGRGGPRDRLGLDVSGEDGDIVVWIRLGEGITSQRSARRFLSDTALTWAVRLSNLSLTASL